MVLKTRQVAAAGSTQYWDGVFILRWTLSRVLLLCSAFLPFYSSNMVALKSPVGSICYQASLGCYSDSLRKLAGEDRFGTSDMSCQISAFCLEHNLISKMEITGAAGQDIWNQVKSRFGGPSASPSVATVFKLALESLAWAVIVSGVFLGSSIVASSGLALFLWNVLIFQLPCAHGNLKPGLLVAAIGCVLNFGGW